MINKEIESNASALNKPVVMQLEPIRTRSGVNNVDNQSDVTITVY